MQIFAVFIPFGGCDERCSFCDQGELTGQIDRPTPTNLVQLLDQMLPQQGSGEVAFYGGTFTRLPIAEQRAYLRVVADFQAAGRVRGSRVSTRADALNRQIIELLAESGCCTVEIGCQSFSPAVLQAAGRPSSTEMVGDAVKELRARSLGVGLQLMPGLPGGDRSEALASLQAALELQPDFVRIYPTLVFAGTRLAAEFAIGSYRPWTLEQAVDCCAEMLWCCQRAEVPVIRLGLQGQASYDRGEGPLAGPYHPAFGQLVRSRLWRWGLQGALALESNCQLFVHPFDLSDALGHRRDNLAHLGHLREGFCLRGDSALGRDQIRCGDNVFNLLELVTSFKRNLTS